VEVLTSILDARRGTAVSILWDAQATVAITSLFERCFFPAVIFFLLVLSVVWFDKITRGLVRALGGGKKES